MKLKIKCDWCGEECPNGRKHTGRNKHNFCCMECYLAFKTKKVMVPCDWCGRSFLKKRTDIWRTKHNFCSHECAISHNRWTGKTGKAPNVNGKPIHRIISEDMIGRKLNQGEEVHHIDFNHHNNRPENLIVLSKSEHAKIHAARKERDEHGRFTTKVGNA